MNTDITYFVEKLTSILTPFTEVDPVSQTEDDIDEIIQNNIDDFVWEELTTKLHEEVKLRLMKHIGL